MAAVMAVASQASAQVKISQVYGAGGNLLSPLAFDYIELYNAGAPQDLTGWSVQYASATGAFSAAATSTTALPAIVLGTGQYLLVKQSNGGTLGDELAAVAIVNQVPSLPAPDVTNTGVAMAAADFKVALVNGAPLLTVATPTYAANTNLVDFVGVGTTANWNDASAAGVAHTIANNAPPCSVAHANYRINCGTTDTNTSRADWAVGWPAPRNTATPLNGGISVIGTALPLTVEELQSARLTATPYRCATNDLGAGTTVTVNTTAIGGGAAVAMLDDGVAPDDIAGDGIYTTVVTVGAGTLTGTKNLAVAVADGGGLSGGSYISILVKAPATPDNDNCTGATALAVPSSTTSSFTDTTAESNGFATFVSAPTTGMSSRRGVWYTVVGTGNTMTASLCATTPALDSVIAVFCGPCDGLTVIATGDDAGPACTGSAASARWCSAAGTTYTIWVGRFATTGVSTAPFTLDITDDGVACATAFPCTSCVGVPGPYSETETGYGPHTNDGCGSTPNLFTTIASPASGSTVLRGTARGMTGNRDVDSYRFLATSSGVLTMTMDTLGTNAQAQLVTLAAGGVCPQVAVGNTPIVVARCATGIQTSAAFPINSGQWYAIQVVGGVGIQVTTAGTVFGGQMPGGTTYQYKLTLNLAPAGACCRPDGTCIVTTEGACDTLGVGAVFHPDEGCPPAAACAPAGACCLTDGSCLSVVQVACEANPLFYRWTGGATCSPNLCRGRCCAPDGTCTLTIAPDCVTPSRFGGDGTNCNPVSTGAISNYGSPVPATVVIPTTGTGGLAGVGASLPSVITVPDSFLIADVNVRVKIQHTFRGDLLLCLQPPVGPSIPLTSTPGCGGVTGGGICVGEDNLNAIFDDEGVAVVCASANLASLVATPDSIRPLPLSPGLAAADGLNALGDWTLIVYDDASGDSGTLLEWELNLERGVLPCEGACCIGVVCSNLSSAACALASGTYNGDGSDCTPSPCAPNGACCLGTGCTVQSEPDCNTAGGVYGGDTSTCASPAPCQAPCCKADGTCDLRTIASCNALAGAVAGTLGTACPPNPCAPIGACCAPDGSCTAPVTEFACTASGGVRWTSGANCTPNLCQGRCCSEDGSVCAIKFPPGTPGGNACNAPEVYGGDGTNCAGGNPCQGRCCAPDGTCTTTLATGCLSPSTFAGLGTDCSNPDLCKGKCCQSDGTCTLEAPANCVAPDVFGGIGTNCTGAVCTGRCCLPDGECFVASIDNCSANLGVSTLGLDCTATTIVTFDNIGLVLLDSPAPAATNVQVVSGLPSPLTDVDVDIKIDHTFFADLVISVEHNGTIVALTDGTAACFGDNPDVVLDDEGTGGAMDTITCGATVPPSPPNYTPIAPLSAFDNMDPNGPWTISIRDDAGQDTGTLIRWSLHIATNAPVCPVVCTCYGNLNGDSVVDGLDIAGFTACVVSGGGSGCLCADMNHVGGVDAADVPGFVAALLAGACGPP